MIYESPRYRRNLVLALMYMAIGVGFWIWRVYQGTSSAGHAMLVVVTVMAVSLSRLGLRLVWRVSLQDREVVLTSLLRERHLHVDDITELQMKPGRLARVATVDGDYRVAGRRLAALDEMAAALEDRGVRVRRS